MKEGLKVTVGPLPFFFLNKKLSLKEKRKRKFSKFKFHYIDVKDLSTEKALYILRGMFSCEDLEV